MEIKFPSKDSPDPERRRIARWMDKQRESYKNGTLSKDMIEKFESLPGWSWDLDSDEPDYNDKD
jgi:hypothetical protein